MASSQQLERIRRGDVRVFEELFFEHATHLRRFVRSMLRATTAPEQQAEEIVQDVFAQLWEKRETIDVKSTMRSYLYAAAHGRALMILRAARVRDDYSERVAVEELIVMPESNESALARIEQQELMHVISDALSALTPRVREAAELKWFSKLNHAEIATVMGTSPATVNNQLTTALRMLRERLGPYLEDRNPPNS